MPGDAQLDEDLLADALVGAVDDIRREVHGALGTRPWRVDVVTRRWSGPTRGVGNSTLEILTLDPVPMVQKNSKDRLGPAGREASGSITLTGVSLSYTEEQLQPRVDGRTEVAYRLVETHGQHATTRWFVLAASPVPRRGDKPGDATDWYLYLEETAAMGPMDGVDAP